MIKKITKTIGIGILVGIFQFVIFMVYDLLNHSNYIKLRIEDTPTFQEKYFTLENLGTLILAIILFIISALFLILVKNKFGKIIYWIIACIPIGFCLGLAVFLFGFSSYEMIYLVFFLIPIGYFIAFYYNYRMINKESEKKERESSGS